MRANVAILPVMGLLSGLTVATPLFGARDLVAPGPLGFDPISAAQVNATKVVKKESTISAPSRLVNDLLAADTVNVTKVGKRDTDSPVHLDVEFLSANEINSTTVVRRVIGAVSEGSGPLPASFPHREPPLCNRANVFGTQVKNRLTSLF